MTLERTCDFCTGLGTHRLKGLSKMMLALNDNKPQIMEGLKFL